MKHLLLSAFFASIAFCSFSQGIKGTVTDDKKQPIPFATIYIENTKTGTSSNANGVFEVNLKPGTYSVIFRSLGYKQVKKEITVESAMISLGIVMESESYQIKEVTISAKSEDPAYAIMRRVIAWAPYHLNQMKHYQSEVYLKGTVIIDRIPKILAKQMTITENTPSGKKEIKLKTGDVFIDESVNEITFDAPDKYKQKVKSMRSTFPGGDNSPIAPIDFIKTSLYAPEVLELISPISPRSFSHYRFSYEGCSKEGDYLVDKIKVIPRRESQKLFSGYIFIVEQNWCIHSLNLRNEQFWGVIDIKQIFSPVMNDAWLPVSHGFRFEASMMGIKGRYNYNATVKFTNLQINERLKGPMPQKMDNKSRPEKEETSEAAKLLAKKDFTKRDLRKVIKETRKIENKAKRDTVKSLEIKEKAPSIKVDVDSLASKRDTSYWNSMRPIPLTTDEMRSFQKRDSIVILANPVTKNDATKKSAKKGIPAPIKAIFTGKDWFIKPVKTNVKYSGLLVPKYLSFNTVDGWVYGQSLSITTRIDSIHNLSFSPMVKYAFNRQAFMPSFVTTYTYSPLRNGLLSLNGGMISSDFNSNSGINTHINSLVTLLFRQNYMKLFEKRYLSIWNSIDLANGLRFSAGAEYMQAKTLKNNSDFSLFYKKERIFMSNIPDNQFFTQVQPSINKSFVFSSTISYTPEYYYRIRNHRKMMVSSRYPTFTLGVRSGIEGILGSNSSYHHLYGGISQRKKFDDDNTFQYSLIGGTFFNVKSIHFAEFKHFNTQPMMVQFSNFERSFQLLDFYQHSASSGYLEGHLHFKSDLLLLKRLPLISNRIWNENIYLNYLKSEGLNNYLEVGYGVDQIYAIGNISVFCSFDNGNFRQVGLKVGINID